jgi:hypothetical protein
MTTKLSNSDETALNVTLPLTLEKLTKIAHCMVGVNNPSSAAGLFVVTLLEPG